MNNACITGRLVADPELRTTSSGKQVTSFCVAVQDDYKKDTADYIDCVAWEGQAEFVTKYFHKGKMIAITGKIKTRTYEDKQGKTRKATELVAREIDFCGKDENASKAKEKANEIAEGLPF